MILFFILLLCTFPLFLVLHFTYSALANKNVQNLYLLTFVPSEQQNNPALQNILQQYKKSVKKLSLCGAGIFVLFHLTFLVPMLQRYVGFLMLIWLFLILVPLYLYSKLANSYRIQVLQLKADEQWETMKSDPKVYADLKLSRFKNLRTPKTYLFLLPPALSIAAYFWLSKEVAHTVSLLFLISSVLIHLMCLALHLMISHAPAKIYSEDYETNLILNQNYRRNWSIGYLLLSLSQSIFYWLAGWFHLQFLSDFDSTQLISYLGILFLMTILPMVLFLFLYFKNKKQETALLEEKNQTLLYSDVDSHYIWDGIWGFRYDNPNNPAVLVNKAVGIGQTLNTGNPKGRLWYRITKILVGVILVFSFFILIFEEIFFPIMQISKSEITIRRTLYPYQLEERQMESIELIDSLYEGNPFKSVGTASARILRGTFIDKGDANARLYLFPLQKPYIKFTLKDTTGKTLLFNYENAEDTLALWKRIQTAFPHKIAGFKDIKDADAVSREHILSTEIDYSVPAGKGTLAAVLNMPENTDKAPVVLFIGGSGPSTKEGIANLNLDFASTFLSKKIAVLRYDERGVASSASVMDAATEESSLTIETAVEDVVLLLRKAKADPRFDKIIIAGHSEGALIGTLAAQKVEVDGIITLAGAGRPIDEIMMEQLRLNPNNPQTILEESQAILDSLKKGQIAPSVPPYLEPLFRVSVQPYLISWMKYDPSKELAKLNIPILIIQGDNDMQIATVDAKNLQKESGGKLVLLEHMTHMLKDSPVAYTEIYQSRAKLQEYTSVYQNETIPINPRLLEEMTAFILEK